MKSLHVGNEIDPKRHVRLFDWCVNDTEIERNAIVSAFRYGLNKGRSAHSIVEWGTLKSRYDTHFPVFRLV